MRAGWRCGRGDEERGRWQAGSARTPQSPAAAWLAGGEGSACAWPAGFRPSRSGTLFLKIVNALMKLEYFSKKNIFLSDAFRKECFVVHF